MMSSHHLPPWIRSFYLFRQRRIAIVSWGVHDLFLLRFVVEGVFGSLVLPIFSRWLIQFCLYLSLTSCIPEISSSFLMTSLLILSSFVYPVTLLRKRNSAAHKQRRTPLDIGGSNNNNNNNNNNSLLLMC